ncbi:hypothetical protein JTB14_021482 [Gonioctena quinquepunctata]|nr:hypothetical protein JTB14_021482 [Gonioctena quinquepunctata]
MEPQILPFVIVFPIILFGLILQFLITILAFRKVHRKIDEGYYFMEMPTWNGGKTILPVHPSHIDTSTGAPRLVSNFGI